MNIRNKKFIMQCERKKQKIEIKSFCSKTTCEKHWKDILYCVLYVMNDTLKYILFKNVS